MSADRSVIAAWGTVPPQNRPREEWAVTAVAAVLVADIGPDGVGPDPVGRVDVSVAPSQVTADGLARFDTTTARAVARLLLEAADRADAAAAGTGPSTDGEQA